MTTSLDTIRVALVNRNFAGTGVSHIGLGVTTSYTAKTLRRHGIRAEAWQVKTPAELTQRLRTAAAEGQPVSHVVIAALWIPTSDIAVLAGEFLDTVFAVVSHSAVGFLSADPHAIRLLREAADLQLMMHNVFIGGNARKFTDWATRTWSVNAAWLPNLYCLDEVFRRKRHWTGGPLRIGLFGANRPLKNFISGAAAAAELAVRLRVPIELLISTGRTEGGSRRAVDEMVQDVPGLTIRDVGWLSWPKFRALLRHVDLVFQVSYTESFNVVSADAVAEGVPVVGSDAIDWLPHWWQAKADEPREISRVAEQLLRDPNASQDGLDALEAYVEAGLAAWAKFLTPPVAGIGGAA